MRKIIITGATSFIGKHLIKRLSERDWKIYAVIRSGSKQKKVMEFNSKITVIELNMDEYWRLADMGMGCCDAGILLAWSGTRGQARMDKEMQECNYIYSMMALRGMIKSGCKTIISAGSQAEYGVISGKIDEQCLCRPNTEYGKWKLQFYEDGIRLCQKQKIDFKEPRFFSLYGEDDYKETMILSTLHNMLAGRSCKLTECVQMWDFLYIEDAVEGLMRLIESGCAAGAYNFASGDVRILKDYIMEMYQITESKSELLFGAIPYPATGAVSLCPDVSKLRRETGWRPRISFSEGIKKIIKDIQTKEM